MNAVVDGLDADAFADAFAAALGDPDAPLPPGLRAWNGSDVAVRFAVHRNTVVASRVDGLRDGFPVVARLLGPDTFVAVARTWLRDRPPASPVMVEQGAGFVDWLVGFEPLSGLPYLADIARLEDARVQAHGAADADPVERSVVAARLARPHGLPAARLRLHPSCRVVRSAFSVVTLWAAHQGDDDFAPVDIDRPEAALVLRDPADDVLVLPLDAATVAWIDALLAGRPLGAALAAAQAAGDFDPTAALALMLRHGALTDWPDPLEVAA